MIAIMVCRRTVAAGSTPRLAHNRRTLVTKWLRAVNEVQLAEVLPPAFGGEANVKVAAFYGDKILGAAMALAQRRTSDPTAKVSVGHLTELQSHAASNEFLREHLADIMPLHAGAVESAGSSSAHGVGTMVEAAVTAVHDSGDHEAITELAEGVTITADPATRDPDSTMAVCGSTTSAGRFRRVRVAVQS